jgi:hypothetical protein
MIPVAFQRVQLMKIQACAGFLRHRQFPQQPPDMVRILTHSVNGQVLFSHLSQGRGLGAHNLSCRCPKANIGSELDAKFCLCYIMDDNFP